MFGKKLHEIFLAIGMLASLTALISCDDGLAGTSTETVTGKTTGIIYLAGGKPAVGAQVRVYPIRYQPLNDSGANAAFMTSTDEKGRYYIDSLAANNYNIIGELNGQAAYLDSVPFYEKGKTLDTVTLENPGILCGRIGLQPGDIPSAATVQILGTQVFTNVDDDGFFELPAMAPGQYRAAINVSLQNYNILLTTVRVRSGMRDTLVETLKPKFTFIPMVDGLKAAFDTLKQEVHLSWSKTTFDNWKEYQIFRDAKGAVTKSITPIASVTDTFFIDRFVNNRFEFNETLTANIQWEYRVAILDMHFHPGRTYGSLAVVTPPTTLVRTQIDMEILNTRNGLASIGDTVSFVARFVSPTRGLKQLRWFRNGGNTPIRTVKPVAQDGSDTLVFICPREPGKFHFRVEIADDGASEWAHDAEIRSELDPPTVSMIERAKGSTGDSFHLHAALHDELGRVVKKEWSIGAAGTWIPTLGNDTVISLPALKDTAYPCRYRVTDDDGLTAVDSTLIYVTPWHSLAPMPKALVGHGAVSIGGKIYVMGGVPVDGVISSDLNVYDTSTHVWTSLASMSTRRSSFAVEVLAGRIYVFGGGGSGSMPIRQAEVYDPALNKWTDLPDMPGIRKNHASAVVGGKVYLIGGSSYSANWQDRMKAIDVYDPALNTWSSFNTAIPFEMDMQAVTLGSDVYVFSHYLRNSGEFYRFNPLADTWTRMGMIPYGMDGDSRRLTEFSLQTSGGEIVVLGGTSRQMGYYQTGDSGNPRGMDGVHVWDPVTGLWRDMLPLSKPKSAFVTVRIGTSFYTLGGQEASYGYAPRYDEVERGPTP
jgi:hypothetical protein